MVTRNLLTPRLWFSMIELGHLLIVLDAVSHLLRCFFFPPQQDSDASTKSVHCTGLEAMGVAGPPSKTRVPDQNKAKTKSPCTSNYATASHLWMKDSVAKNNNLSDNRYEQEESVRAVITLTRSNRSSLIAQLSEH